LLVSYKTASDYTARARLHRNAVYVVERLNWWDSTMQLTAQPV
jgi:hypothetical protein